MVAGALLALLQPVPAYAEAAATPMRIASVNLCADQLLLAFAPPNKIAALGPFSRDPQISFLADRAGGFPQVRGQSEEVLNVKADAIAIGAFDNRFMRTILQRGGVREIVVDQWASLSAIRHGVRAFSKEIGEVEHGARLLDDLERALLSIRGIVRADRPLSFLLLHRRGLVGEGGVVTELLEIAGLKSAAIRTGARFLGVESIVALRADFLVVTEKEAKAEDRGLELLEHPALRRLYPPERRISAPDRLTICAGPSTLALVEHLKAELYRLKRNR